MDSHDGMDSQPGHRLSCPRAGALTGGPMPQSVGVLWVASAVVTHVVTHPNTGCRPGEPWLTRGDFERSRV
jgi:hypothetical protein